MGLISVAEKVNVGGCVGRIYSFDNRTVVVKGIYFYPEGGGADYWTFTYKRTDFDKAIWNEEYSEWDAASIPQSIDY